MKACLHRALLLMFWPLAGCMAMEESGPDEFAPAHGLIVVQHGSAGEIEAALLDYDGLVTPLVPGSFAVEIHSQADGTTAVIAPAGLPSYDFANMTIWIDAPPNQPETGGAVAWISSPGDGEQYYLMPEHENEWGDTLVGTSRNGRQVRVAVPDTAMALAQHGVGFRHPPSIARSKSPTVVVLTLDRDLEFGNPRFVPNLADD